MENKRLVTIKKACKKVGCSPTFLKQLIREGLLTRHKIHSTTYISLREFENVAKAEAPKGYQS